LAAAAIPCTDPQNGPTNAGGFEIDGNLCTNNVNNSDWDVAGTQPVAVDPVGNADTSGFTQGVGEVDGPNWTVGESTSNGIPGGQARSDLSNVYSSAQVVGGNVWAYFGFQLLGGSGTMSLHIELNQKPNDDPSCPRGSRGVPSPCRTPGDVLLAFDKDGSNPITLTAAWTWSGSAWVSRSVAGVAVGRANAATITNLTGGTLTSGQFGEVAVNLTTLFGPVGCSGNYGTVNMRTSASTTLTSALIDWVQPVHLGVPSTCPTVVLQKHWVNGSRGDTARLSINGATTGFGTATSTANVLPDVIDTTHQATADVEPGSTVNLAESLGTANTGTYASTIGCDNGILTPPQAGTAGSFTMPNSAGAGTIVTCTATNTRNQSTMTFTKDWASSTPGDTSRLSIFTPGGITGPTTSTAPSSTTITRPVFSGEPVTVVEALGDTNTSSYTATTVCTNVNDFQAGDFGGSFTVPDTPTDIACTVTNTAVPAQLVLSKEWENGAVGDTAQLTITNVADPNDTDSAIATVPPSRGVRSTNSASLAISPGDTVTLSETLPAPTHTNTGSYDPTSLVCNGQSVDFTVNSAGATASFTVPSSTAVACVYTNTRQQATVVLQKHWNNGAIGDAASLSITGGSPDPASASSTVTIGTGQTFTDTTNQASAAVQTGDQVTVAEDLPAGNRGSYDTTLSCDNGVAPDSGGSFTITPALAGTVVTCTFSNTRQRATVVLQKHWNNGATGDSADLTITGGTPDPATATSRVTADTGPTFTDTANQAATAVQTGDQVTVSENLPGTNAGSYDSIVSCDNGAYPDANGTFTVTAAMVATGVTCTVTNTRQQATVVLQKHWNNGAIGDQAELTITGGEPSPSQTATSTVTADTGPTFTDTTNQAAAAIQTGDQVTVAEDLPGANTGSYDSTLTCDNGAQPDAQGTFTVSAAMVTSGVTCTVTNTRQQATVVLQKHWNNGATGDTANLSITGGSTSPTRATSTVTADTGPTFTDTANQAATGVQTGDQVSLAEDLPGGNTGSYDSTLLCDNGATPDSDGTFTVTAAMVASGVTCTFSNTRQQATVVLQKHWNNGATGDQAELTITGGEPSPSQTATSTVTADTGPTFTDEVNQAAAAIQTGDTVTVTETLPGANTGSYDTTLACDNGATPNAQGTFTVTVAMVASGVTCTFSNTRQQATVVLQKHWNNGATDDSANLSVTGGSPDPATATSTVTTDTGPTFTDEVNQAAAAIQTGDQVTVTEDLPNGNTGSYDTTLSCDNGVVPDSGGSFTITPALAGTMVTCTFTNTRQQATVVLQKHWNNGATGDSADLSITGGLDSPVSATSTVTADTGPTFTDPANQAATAVQTGDTITVAEDLPNGNTGSYDTTLACDNGAEPDAQGTFTVTAAMVASGVTCTFSNTRQQATVVLQKHWKKGAIGDSADLSITGGSPDPATATSTVTTDTGPTFTDTTNQASAAVQTGDQVTVSEDLPGANTGSYDTTLSCDNGAQPDDQGTFTVTAAMVASGVTCTFTNTLKRHKPPERPRWNVEKSADPPSGTTVEPGSSITYTLTVINRSDSVALSAGAVVTDDLADVLNHATFTGVHKGHRGRAVLQGTHLVWTLPEVPPGKVFKLHYSVRIDPGTLGVTVRNSVTARADVAPSDDCSEGGAARAGGPTTATCVTSTTHHTPPAAIGPEQHSPPGSLLPNTGAPSAAVWLALLGLALVAGGISLLMYRRRVIRL
jgi:LPXTG-motif cell wall-anchored protein